MKTYSIITVILIPFRAYFTVLLSPTVNPCENPRQVRRFFSICREDCKMSFIVLLAGFGRRMTRLFGEGGSGARVIDGHRWPTDDSAGSLRKNLSFDTSATRFITAESLSKWLHLWQDWKGISVGVAKRLADLGIQWGLVEHAVTVVVNVFQAKDPLSERQMKYPSEPSELCCRLNFFIL